MKWYAYVIIALVIAVAVLAYLWQRNAQLLKSCNEIAHLQYVTYHDEVIEYNDKIGRLDSTVARHKHERDSVTQSYASKLDAGERTIKRQRAYIAKVEDVIAADSTEFTRDQLMRRDSLINTQDQQIANLYWERAALKVSTEALINNLEAKARLSEDEASKWIGRFQASEAGRMADEKAWRRHRRLERVLEIGGVVLIGIIAL